MKRIRSRAISMALPPSWANPITTRSRVVLEIASELVANPNQRLQQAKVLLREQGSGSYEWPLCLFGSSTNEGLNAVISREAALAIINPAGPLTIAYRGSAPYARPLPIRTIAVIPSLDQYVFAVKGETGLTSFEEIAERQYPLKVAMRGQRDHCVHFMLEHIVAAAGFSLDDLESWGGEILREGSVPRVDGPQFQALARGDVNAIFDEAADVWLESALGAGMTVLPLSESTVRNLESMGYRRALIERRNFQQLPADVLTIDFSGWPIFVHADLPDQLVEQICAALEARKHLIPWQGVGPLPTERMCRDGADTPMDVPLHPAAERFWRRCGYLP